MKKLIYSIREECNYIGDVVAYSLADGFNTLGKVSKEEGKALIKTIEEYNNFYDYYECTTNSGELCRLYYFDIEANRRF